jgi:hypothetical protein
MWSLRVVVLLFILCCGVTFGQEQLALRKVGERELVKPNFRVDGLGYIHYFDRDQIVKYDTTGVLLFKQSIKSYGKINDIDLSNPMKILCFFLEQQLITFLDNTLTPYKQTARLTDLDVSYGSLVCYATQSDRFWVYDLDNSKLILFLDDGKKHLETLNLAGMLDITDPVQMLETNGVIHLVDWHKGVFLFDMFGTFIEFVAMPGVEWIQADEWNVYWLSEGKLNAWNHRTKGNFSLPTEGVTSTFFQYSKRRFYMLTGKKITIFDSARKQN